MNKNCPQNSKTNSKIYEKLRASTTTNIGKGLRTLFKVLWRHCQPFLRIFPFANIFSRRSHISANICPILCEKSQTMPQVTFQNILTQFFCVFLFFVEANLPRMCQNNSKIIVLGFFFHWTPAFGAANYEKFYFEDNEKEIILEILRKLKLSLRHF